MLMMRSRDGYNPVMSDEWYTPWDVVQPLADEFAGGEFDLDPCSVPEAAKGKAYYTIEDDGLSLPWHGRVWMNPPYSQPGLWVDKAIHEVQSGNCELVVALIFNSSGCHWYNQALKHATLIRHYPKRIRFHGPGTDGNTARNGTVIFVFGKLTGKHATVANTCCICNTVFWKRAGSKTCSDACRMALSRKNRSA